MGDPAWTTHRDCGHLIDGAPDKCGSCLEITGLRERVRELEGAHETLVPVAKHHWQQRAEAAEAKCGGVKTIVEMWAKRPKCDRPVPAMIEQLRAALAADEVSDG